MSTVTTRVPGRKITPRPEVSKTVNISADERASRAAAIASANGHNAMEGLFSSAFSQDLQKRYIAGEIGIEEAVQAAKRHYDLA